MPRMASGFTDPLLYLNSSLSEYDEMAAQQGYIGLKLFPRLDTTLPAGKVPVVPIEQMKEGGLAPADLQRRSTGDYVSTDYKYEFIDYLTQEYGLEIPVDDRERTIFSTIDDPEMRAAMKVRIQMMDMLEKNIIDTATNASVYTGGALTAAVTASWKSAPTTAVPLDDITNAIELIKLGGGVRPNAIAMGWRDLMYLRSCSTVLDRLKYTARAAPEDITVEDIASFFRIDKVLIADAVRNTGKPEAAATLSRFWPSGKIWVGVICDENAAEDVCSTGRTIHHISDGSVIEGVLEEYRDEKRRATIRRMRHEYQAKILYTQAAFILTGAAA